MASGQSPLTAVLTTPLEPVATGADLVTVVARVPFAGTVTAVTYAPITDITGAATNHRTVSLTNKGTTGNGTASVAALTFDNGINASDFDEKAITLSGTPANLVVAEGDILAWTSLHVGTGIADPGGLVAVTIARD